eukprot:TRINITY_DN18553_c0_g1_i6.p1 TRINITY_DN18553_c0_g1~~TRINITY_DN18553_c0_g1_i6.p1  ORF type:complete len:180 (-),score=21.30 TRINITY_DN18553_c0_g1_i6:100-639(-)
MSVASLAGSHSRSHISNGTGRDWYIMGDAGLRDGKVTPRARDPTIFGFRSSSSVKSASTSMSSLPDMGGNHRRLRRSRDARTLKKSNMPHPGIVERWKKANDKAPGGTPLRTEHEFDHTHDLPEAPTDPYMYHSNAYMARRLAWGRAVAAAKAQKESAGVSLPKIGSLSASASAPTLQG